MADLSEIIKRIATWENVKSAAKFVAFLVGLWTFHWSIDATLQKYEHDVKLQIFQRLERSLIETKLDGSIRTFGPLAVALQAEEEVSWLHSIHKLLAHDCWLTNFLFHFRFSGRSEERKQLEVYEQHQKDSLLRSYALAKNAFLSSKKVRQINEQEIIRIISSLVEVEILIKDKRSKDESEIDVAQKLLDNARSIGSHPKIVKALETYKQHLIDKKQSQ